MGADGVPREQAELAEMEVRAEGSRRGFSKLGGAPVRNDIPCDFGNQDHAARRLPLWTLSSSAV